MAVKKPPPGRDRTPGRRRILKLDLTYHGLKMGNLEVNTSDFRKMIQALNQCPTWYSFSSLPVSERRILAHVLREVPKALKDEANRMLQRIVQAQFDSLRHRDLHESLRLKDYEHVRKYHAAAARSLPGRRKKLDREKVRLFVRRLRSDEELKKLARRLKRARNPDSVWVGYRNTEFGKFLIKHQLKQRWTALPLKSRTASHFAVDIAAAYFRAKPSTIQRYANSKMN